LKKKASAFVSPTPPPSSVSSLLPSIPAALDLSDASQAWFRRALGVQVSRSPTKRGDPVLPPALVLQYAEFLRCAPGRTLVRIRYICPFASGIVALSSARGSLILDIVSGKGSVDPWLEKF
jgi:hypothetical protein